MTGRFTHIEHNRAYTAWTGSLDVDLGTFAIVRSGSVYRASSVAHSNPKGNYFGLPIGNPKANNAKVIKRLAPIVARYAR